jgi:hypothetical protein
MENPFFLVAGPRLETGFEDEGHPAGLPVEVSGYWNPHAFGLII